MWAQWNSASQETWFVLNVIVSTQTYHNSEQPNNRAKAPLLVPRPPADEWIAPQFSPFFLTSALLCVSLVSRYVRSTECLGRGRSCAATTSSRDLVSRREQAAAAAAANN